MVTIKLYLDTRACKVDEPAPLKVSFVYQRATALLPLGIKLFPCEFHLLIKLAILVIEHRGEVVNHGEVILSEECKELLLVRPLL